MARFKKYIHHGTLVVVQRDLEGKHRQHCLCFQGCFLFKPNKEDNCQIAQELYEFDVKYKVTTPVWECPKFRTSPKAETLCQKCGKPDHFGACPE